jgi:hypothetical protein
LRDRSGNITTPSLDIDIGAALTLVFTLVSAVSTCQNAFRRSGTVASKFLRGIETRQNATPRFEAIQRVMIPVDIQRLMMCVFRAYKSGKVGETGHFRRRPQTSRSR